MRTLIWIVTWTVIALWSGVAWIAHSLVGVGGSLVAGNADILPADPLIVEWTSWLATIGTGVGEWLVVAIWAVVSLVLLALGYVAAKFVPQVRSSRREPLSRRS